MENLVEAPDRAKRLSSYTCVWCNPPKYLNPSLPQELPTPGARPDDLDQKRSGRNAALSGIWLLEWQALELCVRELFRYSATFLISLSVSFPT
jgi:hypothetical protein